MKVINGAILQAQTIELKKKLDEPHETLMGLAITELRTRFNSDATEVLVNVMPDSEIPNTREIFSSQYFPAKDANYNCAI